jgi:hypothetical protein
MSTEPGPLATTAELTAAVTTITEKINASHQSARRGDMVTLIAQVTLTAALGFIVWEAQTAISGKVDAAKVRLASQLALSQDYFKQRLAVYADLYATALRVRDAVQRSQLAQEGQGDLSDAILDLNKKYRANSLYSSETLIGLMGELWHSGIDVARNLKKGDPVSDVDHLITRIEGQMRQELSIEKLERLEAMLGNADGAALP